MPDPLVLTGIGIGTAFGVLVFLLVAVLLIRLASWLVDRYFGPDDLDGEPTDEHDDTETRNRARAAAVAVTALIESRPYLDRPSDTRDQ